MLEKSFVEERKSPKLSLDEIIKKKDYKELSVHLKKGIADYLNGDVFIRYLDFISKFHKYSQNNARLILEQDPNATYTASLSSWKKMERELKKEPKVIYIASPVTQDKKDSEGKLVANEDGEVEQEERFFLTPVFDVSQTWGNQKVPNSSYDVGENLDDKKFTQVYKTFDELSTAEVFIEAIETSETENSFYLPEENKIVIRQGLGEKVTLSILIYELTHAIMHTDSKAIFGDSVYRKEEFEAEAIAYIVSNHLGLVLDDPNFDYLSSWEKEGNTLEELTQSLDIITNQAKELITQIESSLERIYTLDAPRNKFEERVAIARGMTPEEPRTPNKKYDVAESAKPTSKESVNKRFGTEKQLTTGMKGTTNQ